MNHKFKKHQKVRLLISPDSEYVEYYPENLEDKDKTQVIKKGMTGIINTILPNGQYHVEIQDKNGKTIAYVPIDESGLQAIE